MLDSCFFEKENIFKTYLDSYRISCERCTFPAKRFLQCSRSSSKTVKLEWHLHILLVMEHSKKEYPSIQICIITEVSVSFRPLWVQHFSTSSSIYNLAHSLCLKLELHILNQYSMKVSVYNSKSFSKQKPCSFSVLQVVTVSAHIPPLTGRGVLLPKVRFQISVQWFWLLSIALISLRSSSKCSMCFKPSPNMLV